MMAKIALHKIRRERIWSFAVVGLLAVGLVTWMIIPSISASLQAGLSSYSNNVSTYMFVYDTGRDHFSYRFPLEVSDKITSIPGVQKVFPIIDNITQFIDNSTVFTLANGTRIGAKGMIIGYQSAVIGGQGGFPQSLITLSAGKLPENEAGFVFNGVASTDFALNVTRTALLPVSTFNQEAKSSSYVDPQTSNEYIRINATAMGQMPYNPMLQQIMVLWSSSFLQQKLGATDYNHTFGGEGANFFIVKAQNIQQVEQIAGKLQSIFANYSGYSVIYDQAVVKSELSFQSGSSLLYLAIGVTCMFAVISIIFIITYVFISRRSWETGLLLSQGWNWRRITNLYISYYLTLGLVAIAISVPSSLLAASRFSLSFQAYDNTLTIPMVINPYLIASGTAICLLISALAAYFAIHRMRKMGLDNLLREF